MENQESNQRLGICGFFMLFLLENTNSEVCDQDNFESSKRGIPTSEVVECEDLQSNNDSGYSSVPISVKK